MLLYQTGIVLARKKTYFAIPYFLTNKYFEDYRESPLGPVLFETFPSSKKTFDKICLCTIEPNDVQAMMLGWK